jgi:hypothetical protein
MRGVADGPPVRRDSASHADGGSGADTATGTDAARDVAMEAAKDMDAADAGAKQMDATRDSGKDTGVGDATAVDARDAGPTVFAIVQSAESNSATTSTASVKVLPMTRGSFVAVLATYYGVGPSITGVADNTPGGSNTYTSANLRSVATGCQASEIWYARAARAAATSVTVTTTGNVTLGVWVLEVSGLATSGGVNIGEVGNGDPNTTITAPTVSPSGAPALIVSALGSCGTIGSIPGGNPFIALPKEDNNGAAYYVATAAGTFGPVFTNSNSGWNASVAAFR